MSEEGGKRRKAWGRPGVADTFPGVADTHMGGTMTYRPGDTNEFGDLQVGLAYESSVAFGDLEELQRRMGYTFKNLEHLERSLTHPSYANERRGARKHNQRMEFLGDAVLGLIMATELFSREDFEDEGVLTRNLSALVCERALAAKARELGLGEFLRLGKGEDNQGGRDRDSILCDAYEAVMAAVYLDGGWHGVRDVALALHKRDIETVERPSPRTLNYKGQLQSIVQARYGVQPTYHIVREYGPEHRKVFVAEVRVMDEVMGQGEGRSKKQAEQDAASKACALFEEQKVVL